MRLSKVQLLRAVTVNGLLGTRDFITAEEAILTIDGSTLTIETVLGGVTLVPIHNVLYMNAATAMKKEPATPSANKEEDKQPQARTAPVTGASGKRAK